MAPLPWELPALRLGAADGNKAHTKKGVYYTCTSVYVASRRVCLKITFVLVCTFGTSLFFFPGNALQA